jgi:hypothetical protein
MRALKGFILAGENDVTRSEVISIARKKRLNARLPYHLTSYQQAGQFPPICEGLKILVI